MPKLTKRTVDAATPNPDRRFTLWDSGIKGLGLLVLPSGVKSFVFDYRTENGERRRITIGKYGAITPDEARKKADAMRREVAGGGDPLAEKRERRTAIKVNDLLDIYVASAKFAEKADSTRTIDLGRMNRHLRPVLGNRRVESLRSEDVRRAFASIRDGKTATTVKTKARGLARVRGGEGTARMAMRLLQSAMSWAKAEGIIEVNVAAGLKFGQDGARDVILESSEDYGRLFRTLDQMEAEHRIRQPVADAIRVIAMTGARRGEVAGARWGHVDLKAGTITLPPASHKTGRRTGKPRAVTLPAAATAIIARQPEGATDAFVFAPSSGEGPIDLSHPWRKVRAEAALPENLGLHGLRHSLASHLAMSGAAASEIMTALGHRNLATSQKYIHMAADARRAIAERAASIALAGMTGAEDGAEIVPMPSRRK